MKIQVLTHTPNPERVIAQAAKLCYSPVGVDELSESLTDENIEKFVGNLASMGHLSPFEHATFTFAIEGVSRSLSHQLIRHRIASYSQQSQRYVKEGSNFEFITPNIVYEMGAMAYLEYGEDMERIHDMYTKWQNKIQWWVESTNYPTYGMNAEKVANENARYILPNATETKIIVSMNVRSLYNFFSERCCHRAQEEIRELANEMLKQLKEISPILFNNAGAPCTRGKCEEGKYSCGNPIKI
ncbi:FAD-dependent thymidylate synthase [Peptostreptococcus porci]|uniref:FAD-dependent thymidylate synthase n=1 Tax=Peptostreptococcus porci TaxID=2652282 RepID=UPI002A8127CA|nr:FAD-dependent thymidylate synthase [Peptostreptococcus porci]MDY4127728.1 FAD-dependent thymidylate synthase [Peptostreptococcus porci]